MAKKEVSIMTVERGKDGKYYESENYRKIVIRSMKPYEFLRLTSIINTIIAEVNKDEDIKGAVTAIFDNFDPDMEVIEALQTAGVQFLNDALGSVGKLLELFPTQTMEIISILAQIDPIELQLQEMDTFFEITDAVIEVNDFEKVMNQVKKSGKLLLNSLGFKKVVQESTQPATLSPVK